MSIHHHRRGDRVKQIIDHVRIAAGSRRLTLREVARDLGISVSTGQRSLRRAGLSFRSVLCLARLAAAEDLFFQEPDLKVEAVSLSAGWQSRRSLYLAVSKHCGCGLAEWRTTVCQTQRASSLLDDYVRQAACVDTAGKLTREANGREHAPQSGTN